MEGYMPADHRIVLTGLSTFTDDIKYGDNYVKKIKRQPTLIAGIVHHWAHTRTLYQKETILYSFTKNSPKRDFKMCFFFKIVTFVNQI